MTVSITKDVEYLRGADSKDSTQLRAGAKCAIDEVVSRDPNAVVHSCVVEDDDGVLSFR